MIGSKLSLTTRVLIALALLTTVLLGAMAGMGAWGWWKHGGVGLLAAVIAWGVCWVSGVIALIAPLLFRDPQAAVHGVLLGMLCRMGAPLLVLVAFAQSQSPLLRVGVMEMLVGTYLAGLVVETLLSWWIAETSIGAQAPGTAKAS